MKTRLFVSLLIAALVSVCFPPTGVQASDCGESWNWNFTLELPPSFWEAGTHQYEFQIITWWGDEWLWQQEFLATTNAPMYQGQVFLRSTSLMSIDGQVYEINPAQDTAMQLTFYTVISRQDAEAAREDTALQVRWDNGEWVDVPAGPLTKECTMYNPGHFQRSWGHVY